MSILSSKIEQAADCLIQGKLLAYPTESVYGLGCDPTNQASVERLLAAKQRPMEKGLILIANDIKQLEPWIENVTGEFAQRIITSIGITWVVPTPASTPVWLRGQHQTLAVRLTSHPLAQRLCQLLGGAIISTSANITTQPPCIEANEVDAQLGSLIDMILIGDCGPLTGPTEIRDIITNNIIRSAT